MKRVAAVPIALAACLSTGACCLFVPCDGSLIVRASPRSAQGGSAACEAQLVPAEVRDLPDAAVESEPLEEGEARFSIGPWIDAYSVRLFCAGYQPTDWVEVSISGGSTEVDLGEVDLRPGPPARPGG